MSFGARPEIVSIFSRKLPSFQWNPFTIPLLRINALNCRNPCNISILAGEEPNLSHNSKDVHRNGDMSSIVTGLPRCGGITRLLSKSGIGKFVPSNRKRSLLSINHFCHTQIVQHLFRYPSDKPSYRKPQYLRELILL